MFIFILDTWKSSICFFSKSSYLIFGLTLSLKINIQSIMNKNREFGYILEMYKNEYFIETQLCGISIVGVLCTAVQNTWRSLVEVSIKPSIASWNESPENWELDCWTNVLQSNCQSCSGSLAGMPVIPKLLYSYKYLYREA